MAGSESITASGHTRTVNARMTASHNIAMKVGNLNPKNKEKGRKEKRKETAPYDPKNFSDEDDSREREAALSSPIKGKTSRELSKVIWLISLVIVLIVTNVWLQTRVWVGKPSKLSEPIPKDAEPGFSGIVVPTWLQKFASGDNPWRSPNEEDRITLRTLCEAVLGDDFKIDISEQSGAWKKVRPLFFFNNNLTVFL